ncbi:F-box/kelch-repeat protein [Camellia lanceoleosa]|nr:F-box/kelch-repeat protein [Camellia lanceoleosa]
MPCVQGQVCAVVIHICTRVGEGNVMTRVGTSWQVLVGLPVEVSNVTYMTAWRGKLLVFGSSKFGEFHKVYAMDLKNNTWAKLDVPEEYSSHVQLGCCLEI